MAEVTTELDERFSDAEAGPTSWEETERTLRDAQLFWISTVRRDGRPHVTPLVAVWDDGALYFCTGPEEQKAVNLEANPECWIEVKGRRHEVRARRLEGEERQRAWDHMVETWPNYTKYEQRTERQIKVFELAPR